MDLGDLFKGIGSILTGFSDLKSGIGQAMGALDYSPQLGKVNLKNDPTIKIHKLGPNIDDRVKLIQQKIREGRQDPRVRGLAIKVLSTRCGRCNQCQTVNSFPKVEQYKFPNTVAGAIHEEDGTWVCGKCGKSNNISNTRWCNPEKNWRRELEALFNYVRQHQRYTRDIANLDTYQNPLRTLEWGGGDCDDYTITLGSLAGSVGHEVELQIMESKAVGGKRAGSWNHILLMAGLPPQNPTAWLPLDASVDKPAGWYPPKEMIYKTKNYKV